ncbi:MAG: hypothetical protein RLZZ201_1375 [Actinomycetota bacterium]
MLEMRERILRIVPNAQEVLSYGIAAFRVNGNVVCGLLAAKHHVGYYPFSGSVLKMFPRELREFSATKSALHVPIDKPLSSALLKKLIAARVSQCQVKTGKVNLAKYENLDGEWFALGLAAPARRGLVDNEIFRLRDLTAWREADVKAIHGIGGNALAVLYRELTRAGLAFRPR